MSGTTIRNIGPAALLEEVRGLKEAGYRLVQICCTRLAECFEFTYSFDREYDFVNLRLQTLPEGAELPSISGIYWASFAYENEIHDLFGVKVTGINIDYKGKLYKTSIPHHFGEPPCRLDAGRKPGT